MPRAMISKELREVLPVAAAGLALYLVLLAGSMGFNVNYVGYDLLPYYIGGQSRGIPFLDGEFAWTFGLMSAALAIGLSLRQTVGESARGTWLLLLHRPASRSRLIGMKLLAGAGVYFVCGAIPILLYAWWAATPGTHASPFAWWMTVPVWRWWLSLGLVYLGGFLSGIRPGRWLGSRLLPLAAAGLLVFLVQLVPQWWLWGVAVVVLLAAFLATLIFHVAAVRDF
jgi:hypothetical protein